MTFLGATILVLDPVFKVVMEPVNLTTSDLQSKVTGTHVLHLVSVFFLVVGPVTFVVGMAGVAGAYKKCNSWLAVVRFLFIYCVYVCVCVFVCARARVCVLFI
jgi:hypothetical protein